MNNDHINKHRSQIMANIYGSYNNPDDNIQKSEDGELIKGGEGSKGGKVIGHTKSGKPIYQQDHTTTFNGYHKDFDLQDHKDAAEAANNKGKGYAHHKRMEEYHRDQWTHYKNKTQMKKEDDYNDEDKKNRELQKFHAEQYEHHKKVKSEINASKKK